MRRQQRTERHQVGQLVEFNKLLQLGGQLRLVAGGGPHKEWTDAIRRGGRCGSDFDYAAPLAETALLGVAAVRARARLDWDAAAMRFTNSTAATKMLGPGYAYRSGWGV